MHSFIVIPLLLGFIEMATMQWGLEAFFTWQRMQVRPRLAWWFKVFIALLGCGGLVAAVFGLTRSSGGQPMVDPISYLFMVAHLPVALGALVWGMDAFGFKKDFALTMKLFRFCTLLAVPVGLVLCFVVGPLERVFLNILLVSLVLMIPGAVSWGLELFGVTLLKSRFFVVRALRLLTSAVVLLALVWSGLMGFFIIPGLIIGWLTRG